jgi:hypothetical protein
MDAKRGGFVHVWHGGTELSAEREVPDGDTQLVPLCTDDYAGLAKAFGSLRVKHLKSYTLEELMALVKGEGGPHGLVPPWLDHNNLRSLLRDHQSPAAKRRRTTGDSSSSPSPKSLDDLLRTRSLVVPVDLSRPEGILAWMESIAQDHMFARRTDPFDPGTRFADEDFGPGACWNREEVVNAAVAYFQQAVSRGVVGSTQRNGICATLAARGCGKSFIVDHLCRLHNVRGNGNQLVLGAELNARLVPVCISFNGPQSLNDDLKLDAQGMLCARIAHRAFFASPLVDFRKVVIGREALWNSVDTLTLFDAVLLYHHGLLPDVELVILLAVDELVKAGERGEECPGLILKHLKSLLDSRTAQCRLLVTTFDNHQLVDGGTASPRAVHLELVGKRTRTAGSQRPITWLPLAPLSLGNPRAVLLELQRFPEDQLDYLMSLSGGHPRSLALLKWELEKPDDQRTLLQLERDWRDRLQSFVGRVESGVIEEMLARTLLGVEVDIEETIAGATVRSMVQDTVILNALDPKHPTFVPQLSLLRLHFWSLEGHSHLQVRLRALMELGLDLQHRSFEEFHLIFEELRCWAWHCLGQDFNTTLEGWLPNARRVHGDNVALTVPLPALLRTTVLPAPFHACTNEIARSCLAVENQPGFDIVHPMGCRLLLGECRYSEPPVSEDDTGTKLTPAEDVRRKVVLAAREVRSSTVRVGGLPVGEFLAAFVLIAHRDTSSHDLDAFVAACLSAPQQRFKKALAIWKQFNEVKMPVLLFDREALLQHYGPTFKLLGGFMMSYGLRHHGQVGVDLQP